MILNHTIRQMLSEGRVRLGGGSRPGIPDRYPQSTSALGGYPVLSLDLPNAPVRGLRLGATHEWLGYVTEGEEAWLPPLTLLCLIAPRAGSLSAFVGRRCWPCPTALGPLLGRSIFIDPPDDASRLWAIDQALRRPGAVVIADAGRLNMAASRRLQLAAEAGGSLALLARPPWEHRVISAAETRWRVTPVGAGCEDDPAGILRWSLELFRCKGAPLADAGRWIVELVREVRGETLALRVAPDVVGGSGEAAPERIRDGPPLRVAG